MSHLSERTGRTPDLTECHRALRNPWHTGQHGVSARTLAAQLGWRTTRTEKALAELKLEGLAGQHDKTLEWFPVEQA